MAKVEVSTNPEAAQFVNLPVKSPICKVGPCPKTVHLPVEQQHKNRKIYKKDDRTRYCKCNDCGETWKMVGVEGPAASEVNFLQQLADSLDAAPVSKLPGSDEPAIIISQSDAREMAAKLRFIANVQ